MKSMLRITGLLFCMACLFLYGCEGGSSLDNQLGDPAEEEGALLPYPTEIGTPEALLAFFENGGKEAWLTAPIDMGGDMLKLGKQRGLLTIHGNGHTITGSAPCVIRLEDGCAIILEDVAIQAAKTGLGLLGAGRIGGSGLSIQAAEDGIHAAGAITIEADSAFSIHSQDGSAIECESFFLMERCTLTARGSLFAISSRRGDIQIQAEAKAICEAAGDNAVRTEGHLVLYEKSLFCATNTGEHNAAKIGALEAMPDARLELTGGENGVGLFIVEQYEDVSLYGFCKPYDVRIEAGEGKIEFRSQ